MNQLERAKQAVAVVVATVWTTPEAPRSIDMPALQNPADIEGWLTGMSLEDKLGFYEKNLVQTQALYGTVVEVLEEQEDWVKVAIPDQASRKNERGYPGWIPRCQVKENSEYLNARERGIWAVVCCPKAQLYKNEKESSITLSFLTQLPVLSKDKDWITVATPDGPQRLQASEVIVTDGGPRKGAQTGSRIVETGKKFLGLPYLWGGMSAFGYDCSGFAYSMHRSQGIIIPRDASDQAKQGKLISADELAPGDLLFFAHDEGKGAVHHVGIYAGDGFMIHSPETISSIELIPLRGYKLEKEHALSRRYWE
jgi:cell wall-associated NlpC family hydrolase